MFILHILVTLKNRATVQREASSYHPQANDVESVFPTVMGYNVYEQMWCLFYLTPCFTINT